MKNNHVEIKEVVKKLEGRSIELDGKVEALKASQDQIKQEQHVKQEVKQVKKEVTDVNESLSKVNKDVNEVKVMMIQVLEKINMLEQHNKMSSPTARILNTPREDILVAGSSWLENASKSTIIYSWEKNGWFEVSDMNVQHWCASSFIYNGQLFVVGGFFTKTIETLDLNKLPLKWMKCPGELPYNYQNHQTVVYQQRIIHIGEYNRDKKEDGLT